MYICIGIVQRLADVLRVLPNGVLVSSTCPRGGKFLIKSLHGILFKLKGLNYLSFTNAES